MSMGERLSRVLAHLTGVGRYDGEHDKRASDAALWAIARAWDRANSTGRELIGRDVDVDLLTRMREAYTAGRWAAAE